MDRRSFLKGVVVAPAVILLPVTATAVESKHPLIVDWALKEFDYGTKIGLNMTVSAMGQTVERGLIWMHPGGRTYYKKMYTGFLDDFVITSKQTLLHWYNTKYAQGKFSDVFRPLDATSDGVRSQVLFNGVYYG